MASLKHSCKSSLQESNTYCWAAVHLILQEMHSLLMDLLGRWAILSETSFENHTNGVKRTGQNLLRCQR